MAATKNDAYAKGGIVNLIHPFKLEIFPTEDTDSSGNIIYKTVLNWHSKLYDCFKVPNNGGEKYLTFKKIIINNLDFEQIVPAEIYQQKYYYCILEVDIYELKPTSARIKFVMGNDNSEELHPIVFQDPENLRQTTARVILATVAYDTKHTASNATVQSEEEEDQAVEEIYVLQYVHSNLLMTNMVLNGVPVIYPVPFPGSTTSVDGSDQLE